MTAATLHITIRAFVEALRFSDPCAAQHAPTGEQGEARDMPRIGWAKRIKLHGFPAPWPQKPGALNWPQSCSQRAGSHRRVPAQPIPSRDWSPQTVSPAVSLLPAAGHLTPTAGSREIAQFTRERNER